MSNTFEGPGWWLASDGMWYPPERHPDEKYRQAHMAPPVAVQDFPSVEVEDVSEAPEHETTTTIPFAELSPRQAEDERPAQSAPRSAPQSESHGDFAARIAETGEMSRAEVEATLNELEIERTNAANTANTVVSPSEPAPTFERDDFTKKPAPASHEPTPTFSVAPKSPPPTDTERPVFEGARAASVVEPTPVTAAAMAPPRSSSRLEVELNSAQTQAPTKTIPAPPLHPPVELSTSTDIEPYRPRTPPLALATPRDRLIGTMLFLSGVAMIVGSFLNWTTGTIIETGWERGDGLIVIVAGVIGASMAGPILVGFRHVLPKSLAIIAGVVGIIVAGLVAVNSVLETTARGVEFGVGFVVVLVGAIVMTLAALGDQGEALG